MVATAAFHGILVADVEGDGVAQAAVPARISGRRGRVFPACGLLMTTRAQRRQFVGHAAADAAAAAGHPEGAGRQTGRWTEHAVVICAAGEAVFLRWVSVSGSRRVETVERDELDVMHDVNVSHMSYRYFPLSMRDKNGFMMHTLISQPLQGTP